jgi:hypothetical protein
MPVSPVLFPNRLQTVKITTKANEITNIGEEKNIYINRHHFLEVRKSP